MHEPQHENHSSETPPDTATDPVLFVTLGEDTTPWQTRVPEDSKGAYPPLFALGRPVITPGAAEALEQVGILPMLLLERHRRGDWGDLDTHDRAVNQHALRDGHRLLSAYTLPVTGECVWVITEADRSATTLLLPSEY